jgi:low affinity Fe/Cu permease
MPAIDKRTRESRHIGPKRTGGVGHTFTKAANRVSEAAGNHWTFVVMVLLIAGWALTGPMFGFSDTWQLIANTGTTIITFLMVFIIQNTQNRDAKAMQLKLDELLRAVPKARNVFMDVEDEDLTEIAREKEIVDRDDPDPPKDKLENGKPTRSTPPR